MNHPWLSLPSEPYPGPVAAPPGLGWGDLARVWLRGWWIILPVALLGTAGAVAFSYTMTPVYEAGAVILLDRADPGHLGNAADRPTPDAQDKANVVTSQVDILRGTDVVARVIDRLGLGATPMFNPRPGRLDELKHRVMAWLLPQEPAAPAGAPGDRLIPLYLAQLTVRQDPGTYVLQVGFRAPDPILAAQVANAEVDAYIAWSRDRQARAITGAQSWLEGSLKAGHERVVAAEAAVEAFNRNGLLPNVEGRTALDQGLAQITADLAEAQAKQVQAQARATEIRRLQADGQDAGIAAMSGSKVLQDLEAQHAQSMATSAMTGSALGSLHPLALEAEARDKETRAAIDREIGHFVAGETSQANIARATVANLTVALERMKQQVVAAESDRAKLARLEGLAETERTNYLSLLTKLRSYDDVARLAAADVTVLSRALVPAQPYSPRRGLLAAFGFLFAGGGAAAVLALRRSRRDVVRHSTDAQVLTGTPCLGLMPLLAVGRAGVPDRTTVGYSFFREELRSICAALVRDKPPGASGGLSVMVTSSLAGEGKSTFCRELGRFAAEGGVRTLVVHADAAQGSGSARQAAVAEAVQHDAGLPLFDLRWRVPATTLGAQRSAQLVEGWRQEYELVVFDTPPLSAMAESLILAPMVDATIVLARADWTPRSLLASVTGQIEKTGGRLAGLVMTFAQLDRQRGMAPSDLGYYFRRNRSYHRRLAAARVDERV